MDTQGDWSRTLNAIRIFCRIFFLYLYVYLPGNALARVIYEVVSVYGHDRVNNDAFKFTMQVANAYT